MKIANPDLLTQEELLQLIIDNIPQFMFWKDRESVYLGCNMNFAKSAGLNKPSEIVGKTDYDLPWSNEESDFYRSIDKKVMDSGQPKINFEEPQTTSEGKVIWLRTSKIPFRNTEGDVIGILGTYENITVKKELELKIIKTAESLKNTNENLNKANSKLERANIDLEQFAYAASHDLQEPLRMIGSYTSLLNRKYSDRIDENGKDYMNFIVEGVERMSKLIRGILSYSKLGKTEEKFEMVDLNFIVEEKLKDLTKVIHESKAHIDVNLPSSPVYCQPAQIGILFYNLINNGIKFNESEQPIIKIDFEEKSKEWLFSISDNGIGVEKEFFETIFKAFKRLNNRQEYSGSGIGLSICKRIVTLHKGDIWVESDSNSGTTFLFSIKKEVKFIS